MGLQWGVLGYGLEVGLGGEAALDTQLGELFSGLDKHRWLEEAALELAHADEVHQLVLCGGGVW